MNRPGESAQKRRLSAILVADVVGFTRMMEQDDAGTFERMRALRAEVVDPAIGGYDGRIVKSTGDGVLAEFASAVAALQAAIAIQREMAARNSGGASDRKVQFRIGLNVGDIIIDGEDIAGDGVNVAARLESLAEPGGICVSAAVREQVHSDLGAGFIDIGEQQVKNHARPIRAYRVALGSEFSTTEPARRARPSEAVRLRWVTGGGLVIIALGMATWLLIVPRAANPEVLPPPLSLAIMPFLAPGGDAADQAMADALVQEIAMGLERTAHSYRITSPGMTASYKGKSTDPRVIGRELNVRYLVDGELRRTGERLVLSAKLVETRQARQAWSDSAELREGQTASLEAQQALAARMAYRLRIAVQEAEIKRVRLDPNSTGSALELVLRAGAVEENDKTIKGVLEARRLYDEALRLDPDLVPALVGRAYTFEGELLAIRGGDRDALLPQMDDASRRALALDPEAAYVWMLRGRTLHLQWRWESALEAYARAERLDPSMVSPVMQRQATLNLMGRPLESIAVGDKVIEKDLLQSEVSNEALQEQCRSYLHLARVDEAIRACEKALARESHWFVHVLLVAAYTQRGDTARAALEHAALLKEWPGFTIAAYDIHVGKLSNVPAFWEQRDRALIANLRKAGVAEK